MSDPVTRLNAALEGRYRIERELGEGGMATVYLADDLRHERKVALKVLKPELAAVVGAERFLAEIKTTANLQHPHILPLFDSGEADTFLFYVMPYVEGESLRERLDREHQLPVDEAVAIATSVANALDYAHRHGVIHRDIKPANVLLQDGQPVLSDFGIALALGAAGAGRLTETGLSLGTPHYMSPEQATGDLSVGAATDIYALGCVLYEMLVGEPPYTGSTPQAVLGKIIAGELASATKQRTTVPANVDAAIRKALEKVPADRFQSASDFADALGDLDFGYAQKTAVPRASRRRSPRGPALGFAALAAVFAATSLVLATQLVGPRQAAPVMRFQLDFPGGRGLATPNGVNVALSPDGTLLVYTGADHLWLRRLDQIGPEAIPGTEGATSPTFSPDGMSVAFAVGEALSTVSLSGGGPLTVLASGLSGGNSGVDWGPDGMIYFTMLDGSLYRVDPTGGDPELISSNEPGTIHAWPDALPGGRAVLFTIRQASADQSVLAVAELPDGEVRSLFPGVMARYATSGHLVHTASGGDLFAVPFDLRSLEVTGRSVGLPINVAVSSSSSASTFVLSEAGSLVFRESTSLPERTPVMVGRDGDAEEIDSSWRVRAGPTTAAFAFSPDGRRLAWSGGGAEGGTEVWVRDLATGAMPRITFEGGINRRPLWSRDGQSLLFTSNRAGQFDLWSKRADGSGDAELVLDREATVFEGLFSPDSMWIVFREGDTGQLVGDILARRAIGDTAVITVAASPDYIEVNPRLSRDGRWLAYASNQSGRYEVYVRPFPDTEAGLIQVSTGGGTGPIWAHNGRELFYRNGDDALVAVEFDVSPTFAPARQEVLFTLEDYVSGTSYPNYEVTSDDQRFVLLGMGNAGSQPDLIWIQNFHEELNRLVPVD